MDTLSNVWWICKHCRRAFQRSEDLKSHKKAQHPNEYREAKRKRKKERRENNNNCHIDQTTLQHGEINPLKSTNITNGDDKVNLLSPSGVNDDEKPISPEEEGIPESSHIEEEEDKLEEIPSTNSPPNDVPIQDDSPVENKREQLKLYNYQIPDSPSTTTTRLKGNGTKGTGTEQGMKSKISTNATTTTSSLKYLSWKRVHGKNLYLCNFCKKSFSSRYKASVHVSTHTGQQRVYKCQYCPKTFTNSQNCKSHERLHTGERPYKCSLCSSSFASWTGRYEHGKKHHGQKISGPQSFQKTRAKVESTLPRKKKMKIDPIEFSTTPLPSEIILESILKDENPSTNSHITQHYVDGVQVFVCECCMIFSDVFKATLHSESCHRHNIIEDMATKVKNLTVAKFEEKYKQPSSSTTTTSHDNKSRTVRISYISKTNDESADEYEFNIDSTLTSTSPVYRTYTSTRESSKESRRTKSNTEYSCNTTARTQRNPVACPVCKKILYNKHSLVRHSYIHTGEKKFKCNYKNCTAQYSDGSAFKKHMRIHEGSGSGRTKRSRF